MQKLKVSFYVLSADKAQDFLGFICQLTQTALNKSNQPLLILVEDELLLAEIDEALWSHEAVSFVPHQLLSVDTITAAEHPLAPVLLSADMPTQFSGIVLNTTTRAISELMEATSNIVPTRILEIIKPDNANVEAGRLKYKRYQNLGYELTYFKV